MLINDLVLRELQVFESKLRPRRDFAAIYVIGARAFDLVRHNCEQFNKLSSHLCDGQTLIQFGDARFHCEQNRI